jgi:Na+/serine symporter
MNTTSKSIRAVLLGIIVGVVLSLGTDTILKFAGVLPYEDLWVGTPLILFVLFYRTVYNVIGSYVVARCAPNKPMRHAIIVGIIGTVVSALGAYITKDMNLGPGWYGWTLAVLSLPSAWVGGYVAVRKSGISTP